MFDAAARRVLDKPLARIAVALDRRHITPNRLTAAGLITGLASAAAAAGQLWWLALVLWLISRLLDGLDGPLARLRSDGPVVSARLRSDGPVVSARLRSDGPVASARRLSGEAGGFLDITADFTVYGATVVGVAIGATSGFDASWLPFLVVLLAYYLNGSAFLAFSSIAERTGKQRQDGRSLSFLGGLAEGVETIVVHSLWLIIPAHASTIAWVWAAVVMISATQRIISGYRDLSA